MSEPREAGRELDAEIAAKVMGIVWDDSRCRVCGWPLFATTAEGCVFGNCSMRPLPKRRADEHAHYSTDIAAAFSVVEKVRASHVTDCELWSSSSGIWRCGFDFGRFEASADTLPLAICLAALKAIASTADTATEASGENAPGPNTSSLIPATGHHEETGT